MKEYEVLFNYTEYGRTYVKAKSEEEALKKTYDHLEQHGLENFEYDCQDREYDSVSAREIGIR